VSCPVVQLICSFGEGVELVPCGGEEVGEPDLYWFSGGYGAIGGEDELGDVYGFVALSSGNHLDFPSAHPPDKLRDHLLSSTEGDGVVDVAQVGLKTGRDVDDAESAMEAGDFEGSGSELLLELLLPGVAFVQFLTGVEGAAVDGCNESIGDGVDGVVDVGVCVEEYLGCSRGYRGVFLFGFS